MIEFSLKATYYKLAKQFEISKDFEKAIEYYEKSGAHVKEVPRMLMNANEFDLLEDYVRRANDKAVYKWWGQYLESEQRVDEAMDYYKKGEDFASLVLSYARALINFIGENLCTTGELPWCKRNL